MRKIVSHLSAIPAKGHPHDGAAGTKAHIGHGILTCPDQTTVRLHTVGTEKESCHNTWNRKTSKGWCILSLSNTSKRHFQIEKFAGQILETENPNSPCGPKNRSSVPPSLSFTVGWRQKRGVSFLSTVSFRCKVNVACRFSGLIAQCDVFCAFLRCSCFSCFSLLLPSFVCVWYCCFLSRFFCFLLFFDLAEKKEILMRAFLHFLPT